MFETLKNAWKLPDLKKRICYTLMIIVIFRFGAALPVPFLDASVMQGFGDGNLLGFFNLLTGGAFQNATLFALSISPYITSSIVVQLLAVAIPALEQLAKEGAEGRKRLNKITRYVTIGLALITALGYYRILDSNGAVMDGGNAFGNAIIFLTIMSMFTAGSMLCVWLGEQIDEKGIGNGISMILFANIISGIPGMIGTLFSMVWWQIAIVLVGMVALILFIIFINDAERRIPIQYAKRVVGRKVYGGQNTNLPIKVSMSGVMPIIFAQSICSLPATICAFTGKTSGWWYNNVWSSSSWFYAVMYFLMIFFFSWFYSTIQYDPVEIANNLNKNGGFIPGFRPGRPTANFIQKVINKIVVFGAVYLGIVALLPIVAGNLMSGVRNLAIGGTSVIIVVGVALETVKALEAQMLMRHYKGFLD